MGIFDFLNKPKLNSEIEVIEKKKILSRFDERDLNSEGVFNMPKGIYGIGTRAFHQTNELKGITIASDLKVIDNNAFENTNIEEVVIPSGVEAIGAYAFNGCSNLESITIGENVNFIGERAFGKTKIKSIVVPESVTEINGAFCDCEDLETIIINSNVKNLGKWCFADCFNLKNVTLPNTLEKIDADCFVSCSSLEQINLPEGIKTIDTLAFGHCGNLAKINLPQSLTNIGKCAFERCHSLTNIVIPGSVESIGERAFVLCYNLQTIKIEDGVKTIGEQAFSNCYALKEIEIPQSVTSIGDSFAFCENLERVVVLGKPFVDENAFYRCSNLKELSFPNGIDPTSTLDLSSLNNLTEVSYRGKTIKLNDKIKSNFGKCSNMIDYAVTHNKFIPQNPYILMNTKSEEIENFYKHAKDWQKVLNVYMGKWGNDLSPQQRENTVANLYQACTMLGVFQDGQNGVRALNFVEENIMELSPDEIHMLYDDLKTRDVGYNEEFANFYITNYEKPKEVDGEMIYFMQKDITEMFGDIGKIIKNYTPNAYNNWKAVKIAYPNKTVVAHRERGSENTNLTLDNVINALQTFTFENIKDGNEEMSKIVSIYGYSQEDFEKLQDIYEQGKAVNNNMILTITPDREKQGVVYELLEKDDPEGLIIGEKTNCCQKLNGAGEECMIYGATKPNSGFVRFSVNGEIVGQAWVWYNEKTHEVCLDNIEIPEGYKRHFEQEENRKSFVNCLDRMATGFKHDMELRGYPVDKVTIGTGYNDLEIFNDYEKIQSSSSILPEDYNNGYSDATHSRYVVPIRERTRTNDTEREV